MARARREKVIDSVYGLPGNGKTEMRRSGRRKQREKETTGEPCNRINSRGSGSGITPVGESVERHRNEIGWKESGPFGDARSEFNAEIDDTIHRGWGKSRPSSFHRQLPASNGNYSVPTRKTLSWNNRRITMARSCVGVWSCSQVSTLCPPPPRPGETIVKEKEGEEMRGLSKFVGNSLTKLDWKKSRQRKRERERERKEEDRFINTMFREALFSSPSDYRRTLSSEAQLWFLISRRCISSRHRETRTVRVSERNIARVAGITPYYFTALFFFFPPSFLRHRAASIPAVPFPLFRKPFAFWAVFVRELRSSSFFPGRGEL